jgi:MoxR-like ATPase
MTEDRDEGLLSPDEVAAGQDALRRLRTTLDQVLFGQEELLDLVTIALAARGHVLLEGLPGLGKTVLVKALGNLLGLGFRRVQFTPDLLPSDITGGPILQEEDGQQRFVFQPGPIFSNLVLADEINRASPKTQSALLEAMQERTVTVFGETHPLPFPFLVLATQNPIELEGTYPLPEAQLDRFLFKVVVPGVGEDVLSRIVRSRRGSEPPELDPVLDAAGLSDVFSIVDRVFLPESVAHYIARLTSATHPDGKTCPETVRSCIRYGASPRAAIAMGEAGRASALLAGRPNVDFADIERVAVPAIAHRLVLDHAARLEGITAPEAVRSILKAVDPLEHPLPKDVT